jgi:hypothetical protein
MERSFATPRSPLPLPVVATALLALDAPLGAGAGSLAMTAPGSTSLQFALA